MFHIKLWVMFGIAHFQHIVSTYHAKKFHEHDRKFLKAKETIDRMLD